MPASQAVFFFVVFCGDAMLAGKDFFFFSMWRRLVAHHLNALPTRPRQRPSFMTSKAFQIGKEGGSGGGGGRL